MTQPRYRQADHRYVVRARILVEDRLLFTTDTAIPVITRGSPTSVSIMLSRVAAGQTGPANPSRTTPLEGTHWKAIELAGKPIPTHDAKREAHLLFQAGGRLSGSDGCNRITGSYKLKGDAVSFSQGAGTQMACINTGAIERDVRDALKSATRLTTAGGSSGTVRCDGQTRSRAGAQASAPSTSPGLASTSWQLVKFQGSDGTTLTPDDGAKYTIEFGAGGRLTARIDCNRGRGTWKSSGSNQVQFGPLALTRAECPPGSLHDQIVKQWSYVRSYVIKDDHLFLSLMADGGIYEFERVTKTKPGAGPS
jgi:heat shock protein HslJ